MGSISCLGRCSIISGISKYSSICSIGVVSISCKISISCSISMCSIICRISMSSIIWFPNCNFNCFCSSFYSNFRFCNRKRSVYSRGEFIISAIHSTMSPYLLGVFNKNCVFIFKIVRLRSKSFYEFGLSIKMDKFICNCHITKKLNC